MTMDALTSTVARLADACAGDLQAALLSHTGTLASRPQLTSARSALEALQSSTLQLRASVRDAASPAAAASSTSDVLTTRMTQSLEACSTQAATLFKQVSRLDAGNVERTNERFWTVLSVFVSAHVKLFSCFVDILSLSTPEHQNERLHAIVTQEVLHQAAHAVRLAADTPSIFADELSHAPLPYRSKHVDAPPPPYQAGSSPPSLHSSNTTGFNFRRASHDSQNGAGSSSSARSRAWAKITSPVKAFRGHIGAGEVLPYVDELCAAAASGQAKHVEGLLAQGAAVDGISANNDTALGLAAEFNRIDVTRVLLQAGARPSHHSPHCRPPVFVAAAENHRELALLLLEYGASVTAKDLSGQPFLVQLVEEGNHAAMQFLLQHGASANAKDVAGRTPIVHAVMTSDVSMATILLAFGADPNAKDITGRPLLVLAIETQNSALVRFLLDNGADVNGKDITGASVLAMACQKHVKTSDTVKLLLRRGARVDSTTVVGVTVLADALVRHRVDLARILLEHGADPNATEVTGQPLIITVIQSKKIVLEDKMDLLRMMLERGASVYAQDFVLGATALAVARKVECKKLVKLLETYEAQG